MSNAQLEDFLKHKGVKGMKWGVIRSKVSKSASSVKGTATKAVKSVKQEVKEIRDSKKRETGWSKDLARINKMDTNELRKLSTRIQNENDFKRLSKNRVLSDKTDRKEYRTRGKLDDEQLQNKVNHLRAKDQLRRNISEASKEQREFGKRVVSLAVPLSMQAADGKINLDALRKNMANPDPITKSIRERASAKIDKKYGRYDSK